MKFPSHVVVGNQPGMEINSEKDIFKNKFSRTMRIPVLKSCRICLGEENDNLNELISPCKCRGTM